MNSGFSHEQSLKPGPSGDSVKAFQQALFAAGTNPGAIDGEFGNGTEAAVLAFQRSECFVPDGMWDLPRSPPSTWTMPRTAIRDLRC